MSKVQLLPIDKINQLDYEEFIQYFGNVIEHCSICAAAIWADRPFTNLRHLHSQLCDFVDQLPARGKEGILRSHPDLAGRLATLGQLTTESTKEQLAAGLNTLTKEEKITLTDMNNRYRTKFGFPFVICARENKKDAILTGMAKRVENKSDVELITGIEEVKKIAFYRLLDIVEHTEDETRY